MANLKQSGTMRDVDQMGVNIRETEELLKQKSLPFLVNKVAYLTESSSLHDIFSSVAADILKTSERVIEYATLLENSQDHVVNELTTVNSDLRELIPDHYSPDREMIDIFGVLLIKGQGHHRLTPTQASSMVYTAVFSELAQQYKFADFQKITRALRSLEKETIPSIEEPFSTRMNYVSILTKADGWAPFVKKVMETCVSIQEYKASLDAPARERFLERVSNGRAMVDGVAKSSTYISKEDGVTQVSPKHKKDRALLQRIDELLHSIPFIKAVEIDQKIPLVKYHDALVAIKRMNLDVPDAFELKGRLLGSYGACGLMMYGNDGNQTVTASRGLASANLKIVAFDVDYPTSIAHEITHFQDRPILDDESGVKQTHLRNEIAHLMDAKIDRKELGELLKGVPGGTGLMATLMSDREIIARVGEIGFLLNRYNYQDGEGITAFARRVRAEENSDVADGERLAFDIRMVSPIDEYIGKKSVLNRIIYFNLDRWHDDELQLVKDFTHDYFYKPNPLVQKRLAERWSNGELSSLSINYEKKSRTRFDTGSVKGEMDDLEKEHFNQLVELANILPSELNTFYNKGYETGVFKEGELLSLLANSLRRLGDGGGKNEPKKKLFFLYTDQLASLVNLSNNIDKAKPIDVYLAHRALVDYAYKSGFHRKEDFNSYDLQYDILMASMSFSTGNLWRNAARDNRPTLDGRFGQAMPVPDNFLETELFERYRNAIDSSAVELKNYSPEIADLSHLPKKLQFSIAAMHFLGSVEEIPSISSECAYDYIEDACLHLSGEVLSKMSPHAISQIAKGSELSSMAERFNIREYMAGLHGYEDSAVMSLYDSGFLDDMGVTEEDVNDYIDDFTAPVAKSLEDKTNRWKWNGNITPNPITRERVKWFMKGLSYHPAHQNNEGREKSRKFLIGPFGEKPRSTNVAMSPLTAFLHMAFMKGDNINVDKVKKHLSMSDIVNGDGLKNIAKEAMTRSDRLHKENMASSDIRKVMREASPVNRWLQKMYLPSEYAEMNDDLTFTSTFAPQGYSLIKNALIDAYVEAGVYGTPSTRRTLQNGDTRGPALVIYPVEYAFDAMNKGIIQGMDAAQRDAQNKPDVELQNIFGYDEARPEFEAAEKAISNWMNSLGASSDVTAAVLQGMETFGNIGFRFPEMPGANWGLLSKASSSIRLFSVENKMFGQDYRKQIASLNEKPKAPDMCESINNDVPSAKNDGILRAENQMKMF